MMIEEDVLRGLLAEAASSAPPPGSDPENLSDRLAAERARRRWRPAAVRLVGIAAVALAVITGAGALLGGGGVSDKGATFRLSEDLRTGTSVERAGPGGAGGTTSAVSADARDAGLPGRAERQLKSAAGTVEREDAVDGAKVVQTGSVELETGEDAFEATVDRIRAMTVGLGGFVADSKVSDLDDTTSGSITVRVPADSFEQLLTDVRKLGRVRSLASKGTDVTARFSDLRARAAALSATRDRLLQVLGEARTVSDILAVQDRITGIQTQIEQIQGQQRLLEDQTSFGTLAVSVSEPGSRGSNLAQDSGLSKAWSEARRRFGDGVEAIVAWSGSASVVLIAGIALLGVGWLAWLGIRRRLI